MTTNSEEYRIRRIPDNFENGINFAGFNFKPIFLIEGIVLGIIFFVLAIAIMFACGIRHINSSTIGICLVPCVLAIILGIKGINDEPLTTFFKNLRYFNSNKRTTYYNPRIKTEIKSIGYDLSNSGAYILPRDRIIALFTKYKKALDEKNIRRLEEEKETNAFVKERMYFEDDIGVIDKPVEYMSKQEYKQYKIKIKREKQLRKEKQHG